MKRIATLLALTLGVQLAAQAAQPITLGLNYPRTGPYKEEGQDQMRGALLAVDEINAAGGVLGRPLRLSTHNTASRPETAVENVDKLAAEGAAMLFGGASSDVAIAAGKRAKERGLLYFGALTYSNDTTGKDGHRYMFRECNSAWMSAQVLGRYLREHFPDQKYFYIASDYSYGRSSVASMRQATATTDPVQHPEARVPFPNALVTDYRSALEAAAASDAKVLVLAMAGGHLTRAVAMAREMGLTQKMQVVVPDLTQTMVAQAGPDVMQGIIGASPWTWRVPEVEASVRGKAFVESYNARYETHPSSSSASAYSIVHQWAEAARRANSLGSEAIIRELENHRYTLLKDEQRWRDFDHQNLQTVYAVKVKPREDVLKDRYHQDFFEIVYRLPADEAAPSLAQWRAEREAAGQPPSLE